MTVDVKSLIGFVNQFSDREIKVICKSLIAARCVSSFMPFTEANCMGLDWSHSDLIDYINAVDAAPNAKEINKLDIKITILAIMQTINQYKVEFSV